MDRPFGLSDPSASVRRVQGHLVADVLITAEDDLVRSPFGPGGVLGGQVDPRGEPGVERTSTARDVVLLQGSTAVFSLDHVLDPADPAERLCACDPDTNGRLDGGQTTTSTVVFPEVAVAQTVTLQVGDGGPRSFCLSEVPVR